MKILTLTVIAGLTMASSIFAAVVPDVPEPGTMLLLGGGLLFVGTAAWRKNRKK
jgi:hypothetical protein